MVDGSKGPGKGSDTADESSKAFNRRRVLRLGAAITSAGIAGCMGSQDGGSGTTTTETTTTEASGNGAGGGTTDTASSADYNGVELEMWHCGMTESKSARKFLNNKAKKFENQTGATINLTGVPYDGLVTKWQSGAAAGNLPDLVEIKQAPHLLASNQARPINDVWEGSQSAQVIADGILDFHYFWGRQATGKENNLMSWPVGLELQVPVYRRKFLKQAGYSPSDYDHTAGAKKYSGKVSTIYRNLKKTSWGQKEGHYPSVTGMKPSDTEFIIHYAPKFGAPLTGIVDETGQNAMHDTKEFKQAVSHQVEFIEKGFYHPNALNQGDEEGAALQWSGKSAVNHMVDSQLWDTYQQEQPKLMKNGGYQFGLPHYEKQKTTMADVNAMMFTKQISSQKAAQAAADFMDSWATDSLGLVKNHGAVPLDPTALTENDWFGQTDLHRRFWRGAIRKTLEEYTFTSIPAVQGSGAILHEVTAQMYQRIMAQDWSVDRACKEAARASNQILKNNQ